MKYNILSIIILASAMFFMASCEKEIEFDGEQTDPKLVVNCIGTVGEPVIAQLSKSYFFLDQNGVTTAPDGTKVQLYVNDNYLGEMIQYVDTLNTMYASNVKLYRNDYCPKVGDKIKITASAPGFDAVEASTSPMPEQASCLVSDFVLTGKPDFYAACDDDSCWRFHAVYNANVMVEVSDPNPGQTDYFVLYAAVKWLGECQWESNIWVTYDDPVFGNEGPVLGELSENSNRNNLFTDLLFDGKSYKMKIPVILNLYGFSDPDSALPVLSIRLEHLTKEYHSYLNTSSQQGNMTMEFFAEPVHVFSNVKDGYGIVGGRNVSEVQYPLPLKEPQL